MPPTHRVTGSIPVKDTINRIIILILINELWSDDMDSVDITDAKQNLSELIDEINNKFTQITIVNSQGKNAVLISEKKWKNIEETLYLSSIQ